MTDKYCGLIEQRLYGIFDKFVPVRQELYESIARSSLDVFCKGMHAGAYNDKSYLCFHKELDIPGLTQAERLTIGEIFSDFTDLGYEIAEKVRREEGVTDGKMQVGSLVTKSDGTTYHVTLQPGSDQHRGIVEPITSMNLRLMGFADFLSSRLGCKSYCSEALQHFIGPIQTDSPAQS